jgi:hypothetical protein
MRGWCLGCVFPMKRGISPFCKKFYEVYMLKNNWIIFETKQVFAESQDKSRKPYFKPQLEELGDLRTMTLGSSVPGNLESPTGDLTKIYVRF